jgi:large subunit ribosomal protein L24
MHLKTGDLVTIISGRDKKLGPAKVARVYPTEEKVLIEGRNLRKRHMRGNESLGTQSRIVEIERPIYACKVALFSEKAGKAVRASIRWVGADGALFGSEAEAETSFGAAAPSRIKKVRFVAKTGEILD